ncbi:hypothetical protein P0D91_06680 [Pseudomonas sp. CBSPBW29]|uniref:hypothetical protein n=1 Tax=unclassified Pseudomonas TaxID=196821 RepID=UPI0021AD32CF|nr:MULTISPECIES: hypothetical protein [unclassified Pseudomonas]WEL43958.1 hypothetical protein P0D91_06680 [Pseudomonas sp. CBSPBW29]WEL65031.1 hypothetical protein P0D93_00790 [Pseudomonas sp. CBSPGW29]WEL68498.1 hypothetical protein P0D94_20125 [Pseudomonas sp. CBSPCGW29]WEL75521.1 hypothetical protein P0D92_26185 [Pseudomonas sp. CBSPAW29]WEL80246.1 hypothetical protein P0D95_19615 [Pseudomonas sp. CBSPCAW29]WEL88496.1 hypothetical protein P0D90_00170 [Pseudomonas sp. CBSPCBW29]
MMSTATAPAARSTRTATNERFFEGIVAGKKFKPQFFSHELKNGFWLAEGTMTGLPPDLAGSASRLGKTQGSDIFKQVIIFRYSYDRDLLPSGRYTLKEDVRENRFSIINMTYDEPPTPAYSAHRGTVEFFHDVVSNHVSGVLDVYFYDVSGAERGLNISFSL